MVESKRQLFHNYLEKKITEQEDFVENHNDLNEASDEAASLANQKAKSQLVTLNSRLQSLDENFDICDKCDEVIPFERLLAVPAKQLCVICSS